MELFLGRSTTLKLTNLFQEREFRNQRKIYEGVSCLLYLHSNSHEKRVHINVVPRSTMNTNGGTEN